MKRILFVTVTLLTLAMGYAHLQGFFPASVKHFFIERSINQKAVNSGHFYPTLSQPRIIGGVEMIDAFIELESMTFIKSLQDVGVIINCEFDGFVTAQIPVSRLNEVSELPGVINVEISKVMDMCTDSTLSATHVEQVLNGPDYGLPQAYDGTGVIIGIIDGGFDYQHLAFRCSDDTTRRRIIRVYDPVDTTGHPALLGSTVLPGSIFMGEQIDTLTTDNDGSHGTHTASIAAGTHYNGYGGMAPGADIVLCASKTLNVSISETEVANCIKYIYAYADSVDKPCVISVSTSLYYGIHDGTDYLSRAIAELVGPGRIFVISAGNCAGYFYGHGRYTHGPATKTSPLNVELLQYKNDFTDDYTYFYRSMSFETWVRTPGVRPYFQFHILDKLSRQIVWKSEIFDLEGKIFTDEYSNYYMPNPATDSIGYMYAYLSYSVRPNKYCIRTYLYNLRSRSYSIDSTGCFNSRYSIGFSVYPGKRDSCYVDSWMTASTTYFCNDQEPVYVAEYDSLTRIDNFYSLPSDECSINTYAVNDSIISVGNYAARNSHYSYTRDSIVIEPNVVVGNIYYNSSYQSQGCGPTGKALPTVCAPGVNVVAAGSRFSYFRILNPLTNPHLVMIGPNRCLWGEMTGTSMSAPTVAGIIAQWLQIKPDLSPSEIKNIISQTAIKDNFTLSTRFGPNGKIDALAGVNYLLNQADDNFLLGDVNGDGRLSIGDVTMMIDLLLGIELPQTVDERVLDTNQNGSFSIGDVTRLIDILLGNVQ